MGNRKQIRYWWPEEGRGKVAVKSGANRARVRVGEKAAGNESLIVAKDIASKAMNY
jgi:hypothetical protein